MVFEFKFNADQSHQKAAIEHVIELFRGVTPIDTQPVALADEIFPNISADGMINEELLAENLEYVQMEHNRQFSDAKVDINGLEMGDEADGVMLEGVSNDSHRAPHFTIEMETGTGKTYVYFRTMLEMYREYGFRKFIIVVPSIAILEGVKKTFQVTRKHFQELYGVTNFKLIEYDGGRLGQLRTFAQDQYPVVMVMTYQSFSRASNNFYKVTEKLAGERLPYQWVQEARPIVILDEPQNMSSSRAKEAVRTLMPLFVLRYSATHKEGETPNTVYRLTPIEAFRQGLVKQIEVTGISELTGLNVAQFRIEEIYGRPITAKVRTTVIKDGLSSEQTLTLKQGDDLAKKTHNSDHAGYVVEEIRVPKDDLPGYVRFTNGEEIGTSDEVIGSREEVWRAQIRETIQTHFDRQRKLKLKGVKVLSLFFIDRVANYQGEPGTIRTLFEEEYTKLQAKYPEWATKPAGSVHKGYFAKKKVKDREVVSDEVQKADSDEAKEAFRLIMQAKEELLSFTEDTAFLFAHSALKEGWDNPNVFQICTLNQTVSSTKKRQEIGRGLRLCVDQQGNRPEGHNINILTVIANESYESYVDNLQKNYETDGEGAPPRPTRPSYSTAKRREDLFTGDAFRTFWVKLSQRLHYVIHIDTPVLIQKAVEELSKATYPQPMLAISKGQFVLRQYDLKLDRVVAGEAAHLTVTYRDSIVESQPSLGVTSDPTSQQKVALRVGEDITSEFPSGDVRKRHFTKFKVQKIWEEYGEYRVKFDNELEISPSEPITFEVKLTSTTPVREVVIEHSEQPIPDFIRRAEQETDLTRATLLQIFMELPDEVKAKLLVNPGGWANVFTNTVREVLADHVAEKIKFQGTYEAFPDPADLFDAEVKQPQRELLDDQTGKGLYDKVQIDSKVEENFVANSLHQDSDNLVVYFKFPPRFKIGLPRVLGNYNPDWAIVRMNGEQTRIELIRETKGTTDEHALRFESERRKIEAATEYFKTLGLDYRVVTGETAHYWESKEATQMPRLTSQ